MLQALIEISVFPVLGHARASAAVGPAFRWPFVATALPVHPMLWRSFTLSFPGRRAGSPPDTRPLLASSASKAEAKMRDFTPICLILGLTRGFPIAGIFRLVPLRTVTPLCGKECERLEVMTWSQKEAPFVEWHPRAEELLPCLRLHFVCQRSALNSSCVYFLHCHLHATGCPLQEFR